MASAWSGDGDRQDPFIRSESLPHTPEAELNDPPPLPQPEDDGSLESRRVHPNRVPSEHGISKDRDDGLDQRESSIYAQDHENPLVPHHHPRRQSDNEATTHQPPAEDPFVFERPPMPTLSLKRTGSSSGMRVNRSGSIAQPSLHEVMFQQKNAHRSSLEARMVSSMRRPSADGSRHSQPTGEDPFANAAEIPRTSSVASSQGPRIVTAPQRSPVGGDNRSPSHTAFTSEERHAAESSEELFLPNLQREQFIPVRVARDKIKQVLSEMAHMRSLHMSALDTMEKQQAFLKAQLESATATYVKKLTTDYNNRVTALESEYKRRLENLNSNAMGSLNRDMAEAKKNLEQMEQRALAKIKDRERELEQEQKIFLAKLEHERQENARATKELEERNQRISKHETTILELERRLADADSSLREAKKPLPPPPPPPTDISTVELEKTVRQLQSALDEERSAREGAEQQGVSLEEQLSDARRAAERLEAENEKLRSMLEQLREKS